MVKDGRLTGVKVGQQWRFPESEVKDLLAGVRHLSGGVDNAVSSEMLPLHCMQPIQDVFGEIAEVGAVTTGPDGQPLTHISNTCDFCKLILGSEKGRQACIESWKKLAELPGRAPELASCHAGLHYARARIEVRGRLIGMLVAGQFHSRAPSTEELRALVHRIAASYSIDDSLLEQAASKLAVLDERKVSQLSKWLQDVAKTFEQISSERADLMSRLHQIAEMSVLEEPLAPQ